MKTYVITGATSGIGKITAFEVAKASTKNQLIFNTRNIEKGEKVKQEIIEASGNSNIYCFEGDFASLQSVKDFAQKVSEQFPIQEHGKWNLRKVKMVSKQILRSIILPHFY